MGTYEQPGKLTDPTGEALRGVGQNITKAATDFAVKKKKQERLNQIRKNKLNESLYGLDLAVSEIPSIDDDSFNESVRIALQEQLDKVHKLGLESINGDNTEYVKAKAQLMATTKDLTSQIGVLNTQAQKLADSPASGVGSFLNGGENDPVILDFLKNFNDENGKDAKGYFHNGKFVIEYNGGAVKGKTIINAGNNLKNVESGGGLVRYMKDPQEKFKGIFDVLAGDDYIGTQYTTTTIKKGVTIQETRQKFEDENTDIENSLRYPKTDEDDPLKNNLIGKEGQNNWQYYGGEGEYDETKDKQTLRDLITDDMMKKYAFEDDVLKAHSTTDNTNWVATANAENPKYPTLTDGSKQVVKYVNTLLNKNINDEAMIKSLTGFINLSGFNYSYKKIDGVYSIVSPNGSKFFTMPKGSDAAKKQIILKLLGFSGYSLNSANKFTKTGSTILTDEKESSSNTITDWFNRVNLFSNDSDDTIVFDGNN